MPEPRPTPRQFIAGTAAVIFVGMGFVGLADGTPLDSIACACLALVCAVLGRVP